MSRVTRQRGFTLVELLVVVAVIALLIGLLLPALSQARAQAWKIIGASNQKQITTGVMTYGSENDGWIPGCNTSGIRYAEAGNAAFELNKRANQDPDMPVQKWDFISPALAGSGLPMDRAGRFRAIFDRFGDPAQRVKYDSGPGGVFGSGTGVTEVRNEHLKSPYTAQSFAMPATFQWYGRNPFGDTQPGSGGGGEVFAGDRLGGFAYPNFSGPVESDTSKLPPYMPRYDRIKNASRKIAVADGTRYLTLSGALDFDASLSGSIYGAFTSSGAIFRDSTEYGDRTSQSTASSRGGQLILSYRHGFKMNATFWDGHGDTLTEKGSRDPTFWYPSGYIYNGVTANAEANVYYKVGDRIN